MAAGRRAVWWALAAALAAGAAAAGTAGWRAWREPVAPAVPEVALPGDADPALTAALAAARQRVLGQPHSAPAWGALAKLLLANGFTREAGPCLAQAQRLDPDEPRWPYLRAYTLLAEDRDAGLPYLERAVRLCDRHDSDNTTPRLQLAEVYLERDE